MTSETDRPRQRTVAELLAEHGDGAVTGRRRRRRVAEDDDVAPGSQAAPAAEAPPAAPEPAPEPEPAAEAPTALPVRDAVQPVVARSPAESSPARSGRTGDQVPFGQAAESSVSLWDPVVPDRADSPRRASRPVAEPERPSSFGSRPAADPRADQPAPAPGPEPWLFGSPGNGSRPDRGGDPQTDEFARVDDVDDEYRREEFAYGPAGAGPRIWRPAPEEDRSSAFGGPPTEAAGPLFRDDGIDDDTDDEDGDPDYDRRMSPAGLDGPVDLEPRRRLGRGSSEATGRVWVTVVAQWILGALVGAALWVGFRFLWRSLPVVALAAAVLVTVGLVVIVRALLRNDGMRTTLFALLVGLLLTVSPAILVLLNR